MKPGKRCPLFWRKPCLSKHTKKIGLEILSSNTSNKQRRKISQSRKINMSSMNSSNILKLWIRMIDNPKFRSWKDSSASVIPSKARTKRWKILKTRMKNTSLRKEDWCMLTLSSGRSITPSSKRRLCKARLTKNSTPETSWTKHMLSCWRSTKMQFVNTSMSLRWRETTTAQVYWDMNSIVS